MNISDYKNCFEQGQIDEDWIWIIKNRIGPWVAQKKNTGLWDCVNIYSQYICVLKKRLTRKEFAGLIVCIHPKEFSKHKTQNQLKNSMDHCLLNLKLDKISTYSEDSDNGKIVKELEQLFDEPIPDSEPEACPDTVESRMKEFVEKRVATDQYAKICYGKSYSGYQSSLSIETYASEQFKEKEKPSRIMIIECIEGKITELDITSKAGQFLTDKKIKVVIASTSGFNERIKSVAEVRDVQLIRVNPKHEVSDNDILTPRMECGSSVRKYEQDMLSGRVPMTVPLVIQDGSYTTTSLTDFLQRNGIPVNNPGYVYAPVLTHELIEDVVSQIIANDVIKYKAMLERCDVNSKIPFCIFDPYKYAEQDKLIVTHTDLSKQRQLGQINMHTKQIKLSNKHKKGEPRDRFSMAHEYGHHKLHSDPRFREFLERDAKLAGEACSDIWEKHWLEVQADYFASCMLMPREIVTMVYNLYWRKWFKRQDVEPMLVSSMPYWNKDFQNVVAPVARHMGVSLEAMKIRLVNLGLLIDTTVSKNDIKKAI